MKILSKLRCLLGSHGPNVFGNRGCKRSARTDSCERTCLECGAVWHGRPIETDFYITLGDWRRVK
jgi:hypothetical protein